MPRDHELSDDLFILPFADTWPALAGPPEILGGGATVLGRVTMGAGAILGPGSVIRADGHFVRIGAGFHLGESGTVHIAHDVYPAIVGDDVTVGRNAVVHACTVGDDCVIEDDVVVLDGSEVGDGVVIEAGSTVFPRSRLEAGFLYAGSPAKPVRELARDERRARHAGVREAGARGASIGAGEAAGAAGQGADVFVARTARLAGRIELAPRASVFFGCRLDAGGASIVVGENTNIQDNTRIEASGGGVTIGRDTTLGHNVLVRGGRIGDRALIGIGSELAEGTQVADEVLLAAGAVTTPGQHLETGWVWGGRPARKLAALDDGKRRMMHEIVEQYCGYADAYRLAQERLGAR